jgi:hypothetical protein
VSSVLASALRACRLPNAPSVSYTASVVSKQPGLRQKSACHLLGKHGSWREGGGVQGRRAYCLRNTAYWWRNTAYWWRNTGWRKPGGLKVNNLQIRKSFRFYAERPARELIECPASALSNRNIFQRSGTDPAPPLESALSAFLFPCSFFLHRDPLLPFSMGEENQKSSFMAEAEEEEEEEEEEENPLRER